MKVTGAAAVDWLDFPDARKAGKLTDSEWKGLDFIQDSTVQDAWRTFWPQGAGIQNWDAVARVRVHGNEEWLLVEAKAHIGEIMSNCSASVEGGRGKIEAALALTKESLGVKSTCDWMNGYYQYCNRLAVIQFLAGHGIGARLLFIYFTGDRSGPGRECPMDEAGWKSALDRQNESVGLAGVHRIGDRVHKLFLPVFHQPERQANRSKSAGLILKAVQFAAEKHRNQRRKDKDASPYINHPVAVAHVLAGVGGVRDPVTLAAALLHDTVEDTETSPQEIQEAFGEEIRDLVIEMTDDKSLPKDERKRLQIEHATRASAKAKAIKFGDKICNLRDVMDSPPADWPIARRREYLDWTERVIAGCRGVNSRLEQCYDETLKQARTALAAQPD